MKKRNLCTTLIWVMAAPVMLIAQDAKLEVEDGAVLFRGTTGDTPLSGGGTRMMWIPDKAAFRVGYVFGAQWDDANIGHKSFASGSNNTASATSSFVGGGLDNIASNSYTFVAGGWDNLASGFKSFVGGGQDNTASSTSCFVGGGENNSAENTSSFIGGGEDNTASGIRSFVGGGASNTTSGASSFIGGGENNWAYGNLSFIGGGVGLSTRSFGEAVFGTYNTNYTAAASFAINAADRLFVIGNGTSTTSRSNAVTVMKNGRVGIGVDNPSAQLQVVSNSTTDTAQIHIVESGSNDFGRINFSNGEVENKHWTIAARNKSVDAESTMNFFYLDAGNILSLKGDGDATLMGSLMENSDIRLKQNIVRIDQVLPFLLQLNAYRYDWKYLNKDKQIGFIAQEVREVYPELVKENDEGILSVNYTKFVPLLIEAIKEQQIQIESLTSEIANLKGIEIQLAQITSALTEMGVNLETVR